MTESSEARTREHLIDPALKRAGWNVDNPEQVDISWSAKPLLGVVMCDLLRMCCGLQNFDAHPSYEPRFTWIKKCFKMQLGEVAEILIARPRGQVC